MSKQTKKPPTILFDSLLPAESLVRPKHAAEYLGITKAELLKLTRRGEIPYGKHGRWMFFTQKTLDVYIAEHQAVAVDQNDRRARSIFAKMNCAPNCAMPRLDELDEKTDLHVVTMSIMHFTSDYKIQPDDIARKELRAAAIACLGRIGINSAETQLDAALRVDFDHPAGQAEYLKMVEAINEIYTDDELRKLSDDDAIHLLLTGLTMRNERIH